MLRQRLIPSLLISGDRLVKGVRFADPKDAGAPATTARAYNYQGADELAVLDIDASKSGRDPDVDSLRRIAEECAMALTFGGGVRNMEIAQACFHAGAEKVCLTTAALDEPDLIDRLAQCYGSQAVVLGVDVLGEGDSARLYDHRKGSVVDGLELDDWVLEAARRGVGEIRVMSVEREGTRRGLDLELLRRVRALVSLPVVIEGGAGVLEHIYDAVSAGADGIGLGTILIFSDNNLIKVKRYLAERGCNVRT